MTAAEIAARLQAREVRPGAYMARCPAHNDHDPSLSVTTGTDGWVRVKCFAGCTREAVLSTLGLKKRDLAPVKTGRGGRVVNPPKQHRKSATPPTPPPATSPEGDQAGRGLTLEQYAEHKRLPVEFLRSLGLVEVTYMDAPAVRIPYRDPAGAEIAVRFRIAATGKDKFRWRSGDKAMLYGLDRLQDGDVLLVEGESDSHTLWAAGFNALGLPGASNWREDRDARLLEGAENIYIIIEPDAGGAAVKKWLSQSSIRDRARLVNLGEHKDPSALYLADPAQFKSRMRAAMTAAVPWSELEAMERSKAHEAAGLACNSLSTLPSILDGFVVEVHRAGLVGEDRNAKLLYLALTSRVFTRPVSVAVKGPSSGGKSYSVETVLRFMPEAAYYALTTFSEHALAYSDEPLQNRVLVLYEVSGMTSDLATYLIRSLLSEGCIRYETVEKTADGLRPKLIEREGPTGLIVTTTKTRLHPENETRLLTLTVQDTPAQTAAVLGALAGARREQHDLTPWIALQDWIASGPVEVEVPYAAELARLIPPVAVRLRRDFTTLLALIRAHALLHQATRPRDTSGAILATLQDYKVVRDLLLDLLSAGVEATVPATVREVVEAVCDLQGEGDDPAGVSLHDLARVLKLDRASASRRAHAAADRGFLRNMETKRGRPARWITDDPMPADLEILPPPEALEGSCTVAVKTEGIYTPPPPLAGPETLEVVEV